MGAAIRDGIVALACVVGTICRDAADFLVRRDLAEQVWQNRCVTNVASGDLDGSDFQRFLVDPEVDLAPDPAFRAAMLAGVPLAFALDLDARAVDEQVQRATRPTVGDVDGQGLLTAGQRAEVGYRPVEANQPQQALDEPGRLPERHAEQNLHRKARLDGGIAVGLLSATPACRHGIPAHLGVEPDCQRAPALERLVIGWPVPGPVGWGCRSAHAAQLPRWIHEMNPSKDLCNRAKRVYNHAGCDR